MIHLHREGIVRSSGFKICATSYISPCGMAECYNLRRGRLMKSLPTILLAVLGLLVVAPMARAESPPTAGRKAAIIALNGEIDDYSANGLIRCFEAAKAAGAEVVILDIDSPGGRSPRRWRSPAISNARTAFTRSPTSGTGHLRRGDGLDGVQRNLDVPIVHDRRLRSDRASIPPARWNRCRTPNAPSMESPVVATLTTAPVQRATTPCCLAAMVSLEIPSTSCKTRPAKNGSSMSRNTKNLTPNPAWTTVPGYETVSGWDRRRYCTPYPKAGRRARAWPRGRPAPPMNWLRKLGDTCRRRSHARRRRKARSIFSTTRCPRMILLTIFLQTALHRP